MPGAVARSRTRRTPFAALSAVALVATIAAMGPAVPAGAASAHPDRPVVPAACTSLSPIVSGTGVAGSITAAGQADCYSFKTSAGKQSIVRGVATSGTLTTSTTVFDNKARAICGPPTDLEQHCRLLSGGTYTIMVRDAAGTDTGDYQLYLHLNPTHCTGARFGHAITGSIAAGVTDCYKFRAIGGDHLRFGLVGTAGSLAPDAEIIKPDGVPLCETSGAHELSCRATADGAYTVLVSDLAGTGTGGYTFYVQRLDGPLGCHALTLGDAPLARSITVPGDEQCFTFPGTLAQRVKVVVLVTQGPLVTNTEVIRPDGNDACPATTNTTNEHCLLFSAGTYMLLIRDLDGTNTGSYTVAVSGL